MKQVRPGGVMVGRQHLLDRINRFAVDRQADESQGIVIISSPPGVGKTRMVIEMERSLPSVDFIYLSGDPSPGTSVFESFVESWFGLDPAAGHDLNLSSFRFSWQGLLNGLSAVKGGRELLNAGETALCRRALAHLSGLADEDDDRLSGMDPKQRSDAITVSIVHLFRMLALIHRPAFVFENVHWFTSEEMEITERLMDGISEGFALFVVTCRPDEEGLMPHLPETGPLVGNLNVQLSGLPRERVSDLVHESVGTQPDEALLEALWQIAGGIPLFILQTLYYLLNTGSILETDGRLTLTEPAQRLPRSIMSVLDHRIALLPEHARLTAVAASVLGSRFSSSTLRRMVGDEAWNAVISGDDLQGVISLSESGECYFEHILLRERISETADGRELSQLHSRAAEILTLEYGDSMTPSRSENIAVHHLIGGNDGLAAEFMETAASGYAADHENESAARIYRKLIPLLQGKRRIEMELELAEVYKDGGLLKEGIQVLRGSLERLDSMAGPDGGDPEMALRAKVMVKLSGFLGSAGELSSAESMIRDAITLLEDRDDLENLATAVSQLGMILMSAGRMEDAMELMNTSIELARQHGSRRLICAALYWTAIACRQLGDLQRMEELTREQVRLAEAAENTKSIIKGYDNLMRIHIYKREYREAEEIHGKLRDAAEETGNWAVLNTATSKMGIIHIRRREMESAIRCFRKCIVLSRKTGNKRAECAALGNLAHCSILQGDTDAAMRYSTELIDRAGAIGFRSGLMSGYARMGYVFTLMGDYGSALECLQTQIEHAQALKDKRNLSDAWAKIAEIQFNLGRLDDSMESLSMALDYSNSADDMLLRSVQLAQMGRYMFIAGDHRCREILNEALQATSDRNESDQTALRCRMFLQALEGGAVLGFLSEATDPQVVSDIHYCHWKETGDEDSAAKVREILRDQGLPDTHPLLSRLV